MRYEDKLARLDEIVDEAKWWFVQNDLLELAIVRGDEDDLQDNALILRDHIELGPKVSAYLQLYMSQFCITDDVIQRAKDDDILPDADSLIMLLDRFPDGSDEVQRYVEEFMADGGIHGDIHDVIMDILDAAEDEFEGGGEVEDMVIGEVPLFIGGIAPFPQLEGNPNEGDVNFLPLPLPLPLRLIRQNAYVAPSVMTQMILMIFHLMR